MDRLLVIDDDMMNRMLAKRVLQDNYETRMAQSGEEGLEMMRQELPDAVLLDLHMPGMSGLDVIACMKADETLKSIPVVFLTADTEMETEVGIFKSGADDYLTKPIVKEVAVQRIGRIIESARLRDNLQAEVEKKTAEIRESKMKFQNLSKEIMLAISSAIDAKDNYTKGHSSRVAEYSKAIALRMGMSLEEAEDVYFIGLLHDTGKIGVADTIINKKGKLDDDEYAQMKQHPYIGSKILENISELPDLSIAAHWHHERYDGNGYPDRLAGADIPLIARIVAVADTYDAMTSNRSYRATMPQEKVRAEIERCKGSQFDPGIADIMLSMIDEDTDYQMREL